MPDNDTQVQPVEQTKTQFPSLHAAMGTKTAEVPAVQPVNNDVAPAVGDNKDNATTEAVAVPGANSEQTPTGAIATEAKSEIPTPAAKVKLNLEDLTDEEREEAIFKLTGKTSAELNPPAPKSKEDQEKEAAKRKADARAWALENGIASTDDYDRAAAERGKSDRELALQVFTDSLLEEDKTLTREEAEQIFSDTYHEGAEGKLLAIGQKEIKKLADSYRNEKFSAIDGIDQKYEDYVQTATQFKVYKGEVKKIAADLPKEISIPVSYKDIDGNEVSLEYKVDVDSKIVDKIVSELQKENNFGVRNVQSDGKIDYKSMKSEIEHYIKASMFDTALATALQKNSEDVEKRTIAILGNKRNPQQEMPGSQAKPLGGQQKQNTYPSLNKAVSAQR